MAETRIILASVIAKGTLLQFPASNHILREVKRLQKVSAKSIDGTRLIGYEPLPFPFDGFTDLSPRFFLPLLHKPRFIGHERELLLWVRNRYDLSSDGYVDLAPSISQSPIVQDSDVFKWLRSLI